MARSAPARCSKVVSMVQPCCVRKGRFSVAKRAGSVQPTRRYANPLLGVEMWRTRYLNDAVSLATSTAVRLPLQKAVFHNPSALFCVRDTLFRWCEVCAPAASVRRYSHAMRIPQRLLPAWFFGGTEACSAERAENRSRAGLREFYRAGSADGYLPGRGLLRVYLQPQAASVPAAVDRRLDALRPALSWAGARAVGPGHSAANRLGSLALRGCGDFLFPGRATLFAAQAVESCRWCDRRGARRLGRGQRPASFLRDRRGSRGPAVRRCRHSFLAGK